MATVTLPGIGTVDQKYVYAGGALVLGIVGFAYWKRASAEAPPSWEDVDQAQLLPATDHVTPGSSSNIPPQDLTGDTIKTNAQWAQAATEKLGNIGYEPKTVADAIGVFLARQELTAVQATAILAAKGLLGDPPEGRPWPVRVKSGPPPTDIGTHTPMQGVANLRVVGANRTSVTLAWDAVAGASEYRVILQGRAGSWHSMIDDTSGTTYTVGPLPLPSTTYTFFVNPRKGEENGPSRQVQGSTTA